MELNGEGKVIRDFLQDARTELTQKYPSITKDNMNCALDLSEKVLNTFTRHTLKSIADIKENQAEFFRKIRYIVSLFIGVAFTILGSLLSDYFIGK